MTDLNKLEEILQHNREFQDRISPSKLPPRRPEPFAVITCMDPRINLEAIGIPAFAADGEGGSDVRIMRSIGGMADARSLIAGIFLAGIREFAILMHTDCGCCLAWSKIDTIVENINGRLSPNQLKTFQLDVSLTHNGDFPQALRQWLKTFEDPRDALQQEIDTIHAYAFMPSDIIVHGLLYDVVTGAVEVVVNGYE